jgi:hypothetical protein
MCHESHLVHLICQCQTERGTYSMPKTVSHARITADMKPCNRNYSAISDTWNKDDDLERRSCSYSDLIGKPLCFQTQIQCSVWHYRTDTTNKIYNDVILTYTPVRRIIICMSRSQAACWYLLVWFWLCKTIHITRWHEHVGKFHVEQFRTLTWTGFAHVRIL